MFVLKVEFPLDVNDEERAERDAERKVACNSAWI
jgi:hypothetical protein